MTAIFKHKRMKTGSEMLPFGGRETIFIGDLVTSNIQGDSDIILFRIYAS